MPVEGEDQISVMSGGCANDCGLCRYSVVLPVRLVGWNERSNSFEIDNDLVNSFELQIESRRPFSAGEGL